MVMCTHESGLGENGQFYSTFSMDGAKGSSPSGPTKNPKLSNKINDGVHPASAGALHVYQWVARGVYPIKGGRDDR
jgi:hypothetical protein